VAPNPSVPVQPGGGGGGGSVALGSVAAPYVRAVAKYEI
jgi:hypothetical protein